VWFSKDSANPQETFFGNANHCSRRALFSLIMAAMKKPMHPCLALFGAALFAGAMASPPSSHAQAPNPAAVPAAPLPTPVPAPAPAAPVPAAAADADQVAIAKLVAEIAAQQAKIVENQRLIDANLATITENLRIARIYVSRGGGAPPKK
jgi:hypothetical protein